MNDSLASILAATFRGTNEEVEKATVILDSYFCNPDFPNLLFSLIINQKYEIAIRKSAAIQIYRLIYHGLISSDLSLLFCQEFANVIESCERELSPILAKCSNKLINFLYLKDIDPSNCIFQLLSQNHPKSSLFYANSLMKIISNPTKNTLSLYKSFTSNYINSLNTLFLSLLPIEDENLDKSQIEIKAELISLIFRFLSRSTTYSFPVNFHDYSQLILWMPDSMESFNLIHFDKYHYLRFLSNLPKFLKKKSDTNFIEITNKLASWTCSNLNTDKTDIRCISMTIKIIYNLIKYDLFQVDPHFFIELLETVILPNFDYDSIVEYNHPQSQYFWDNTHNASLGLFEEIISKDNQFLNIFYSLFQSVDFIRSNLFISALDLYSFYVKMIYQINPSQFILFLSQLGSFIELIQNNYIKIVCLKILSKLDSNQIKLPDDFLLKSIYFSFSNIFNEDPLVCYFAALASSSLISKIQNDVNLSKIVCENTPLIQKMDDLFQIFFQLERDYQTQMITSSLMKIIYFFGQKIQPFLYQITNEVVGFFFFFASNQENREPSILLASILDKLIELAEGDIQYTILLLHSLLNGNKWSNVRYPSAFDKLFELFTSLIYHSQQFIDDFCQILPFLFNYLLQNENNDRSFSDFSNVIEMMIWKKSKIVIQNENQIEKLNSIDSILINYLMPFLQSCDFLNEWIIAASLSIKIESFAQNYEMNFILPKFLTLLSANANNDLNLYVYDVIEHMFSFFSANIFANDPNIANFLFNQIFIPNAKFPSFIDAFLKCFITLPDEYKTVALQKAIDLIDEKYSSNSNKYEFEEDYEDEYDEKDQSVCPIWFDEKEIMSRFVYFCDQFCSEVQDFPEKQKLLSLLSIIRNIQTNE